MDLNHRPPAPEAGALARLRYAPTTDTASEGSLTAGIFRVAHPLAKQNGPKTKPPESSRSPADVEDEWVSARSYNATQFA